MGRPKEHDAATGTALLNAAEDLVVAHGVRALSVRAVANEVGTTTRAIYSVFGSKDDLVAALGARIFDLLGPAVRAVPVTQDAAADLVAAGVNGFRGVVISHPVLFALGVQQTNAGPDQRARIHQAADNAWTVLHERVARVQAQAGLGDWHIDEAATAFHALCEGLAALEIRGVIAPTNAETRWRNALTALVAGFTTPRTAATPTTPA